MKAILLSALMIGLFGCGRSDRQTESTAQLKMLMPSPVFSLKEDCQGFAASSGGLCRSSDCKGVAYQNIGFCMSND